jgi:hypothetical protein
MQAITTKYFGATNYRGSRVKARCEAGSITLSWDHALDSEGNHDAAALALIHKLGWDQDCYGTWYRGGLPTLDGNVYVCAVEYARILAPRKARKGA